MDLGPLRKITATAATDVAARFEASEEGAALLKPDMKPADYLKALIDAGHWTGRDPFPGLRHAGARRASGGPALPPAR